MKLSKDQVNMFFRAFAEAWKVQAADRGKEVGDKKAMEEYRHSLILRATGQPSLTMVTRTKGFDNLMLEVCQDARMYEVAGQVELSAGLRIRARAEDCLRQICEINGNGCLPNQAARWTYVCHVTQHAFGTMAWQDIAEDQFDRVFMMLDTHRRRLLRKAGWVGGKDNPTERMGFEFGARYARDGMRVVFANDPLTRGSPSRPAGVRDDDVPY
jgi:hypothetical protein